MKKPKPRNCKLCKAPLHPRRLRSICVQCELNKQQEKKEKHKLTKTYKRKTLKKLHKKAWGLMSLCVRLKYSDQHGNCYCYTCPVVKNYKKMDAGHFHHGSLDYDERNLRVGCDQCNRSKHGNLAIYGTKLEAEIGHEAFQQLGIDARKPHVYTIPELEKIIEDLEGKLKSPEMQRKKPDTEWN